MNFHNPNILNSTIRLTELYDVVSSEGIRTAQFKTGVLLHVCTKRLRTYPHYPNIVPCIHAAGGYVVHHTAFTIVAEWVEENVQLSDTISQVVQCAFKILEVYKLHSRPIKIALSAGTFAKMRLGDEEHQVCAVIGPAVEEIRSAEALLDHGDFILCPEAWRHCDRQNLTVENIENEEAVKVQYSKEQQSVSVEDRRRYNVDIHMPRNLKKAYLLTNVERDRVIRKFMMQTALNKIHENWQWTTLPDIWPATIMFVNLQFVQTRTDLGFSRHKGSEIIAEQMFSCRGEICNVFFFDEGCIFVCAVGLPGDKRPDKTAQALQAAYRIHETCRKEIDSVLGISIGVATGRVLYEFEQTPLRKEYRVSGEKVYLAADLSMDYPGIVSCDVTTKLYSMLPLSTLVPQGRISQLENVCYRDDINQMLANKAAVSSGGIDGRRLALANMQTMEPLEEMVVKYASAIGYTFTIEMLKHMLPHMREHELAIPLRSLFRAGIFKCSSKPRNVSLTQTCYCENICKEYTWFSMDPVWTCRQMSFCNNDEMEMVHKLTERNKGLLCSIHMTCANYLEKKTYRCSKCDDRSFIFEHKRATDDSSEHLQEIYKAIRPYEIFRSQGICSRNQVYPTERNCNDTKNILAKVNSVPMEVRHRMTAGSCECAQLVETVLIPRVRHWRFAGDVPRTFYYLLESAAACVYLQNDPRALEYLTEARSILENLKGGRSAFPSADPGEVKICEFQQAFMHRLTGEIQFKAGKILEAEENFKKALKILNCKLPRSSVAQSFKLIYEKMKKLHYRSKQFQIPEKRKLDRLQECIDCLSFLWQIGCMCGQLRSASLAITMEINLAFQSASPFKILCSAIDYLKYSQFIGEESECKRLEAFLCRTCASLSDHPEGRRLISRLTPTLAAVKMCTGDLEQSIECTV
ncbi:adenylate cyclase type 10 [Ictalurus punctatus]|uniref:Adenylate cyclase type 10 n=1 Tax=Ictalurus punctatus TaxID=7998 RepID=A0A2D0RCH3_ICTPU|nr:adenylate cyclase type 10 [Ictalurus punctatus]